jgi:hypothetical protein
VIEEWRCEKLQMLWASRVNRYIIFYINIWIWESYSQDGCNNSSQLTKNKIVWGHPRTICKCFSGIHRTLGVGLSLWMEHGYTTTLLRPRNSQNNGFPVGSLHPKKAKTVHSAGKVMATVCWDSQWIILINYLEKGKTITGASYSPLLDRLKTELQEKCPWLAHKKILFHHDDAPAYSSRVVDAKLMQLGFQLVPYHSILHIWLPWTITCSPIWWNDQREGDSIQMRKWWRTQLPILLSYANLIIWKGSTNWSSVGQTKRIGLTKRISLKGDYVEK